MHPNYFHKTIVGAFVVASSAAILFLSGPSPRASAYNPSTKPRSSDLMGNLELPYDGLGVVWIRSDGLIIIEVGDNKTVGFRSKLAGFSLAERDDRVTFSQEAKTGTVVHRFPVEPVAHAEQFAAVFHIVGYLDLEYDEQAALMRIDVHGAKQSFKAEFGFKDAVVVASPRSDQETARDPAGEPSGRPAQVVLRQCSCSDPSGSRSRASKSCPVGYECMCMCSCSKKSGYSLCSRCAWVAASEVVVVPEDVPNAAR
ncbi:MAG TPA: hypothetical protein VJZ71_10350 [Phycisphaerae bacterium]|nr:hypothetical protein [Phycisphaerae bacterium]